LLVAVAVLASRGVLGAFSSGALTLLPGLVLAAVLFGGRYPGERLIERWARARPLARWAITRVLAPVRPHCVLPHGGRLIANSLAGRAPPAFAAG
jgi:hypothetical protein